tara:strand:+ start:212 stop:463 length:252 start_codon:yes stop_codon:yes gene_type:complete
LRGTCQLIDRLLVGILGEKKCPPDGGAISCGTGLIFNCCDPIGINSDHGKIIFYLREIINKWMVILPLNTFQASNARAVALVT